MQQLTGSTAKLWVKEKCADPIMVDLSVDGPENSFLNGYRGRFGVGGDGLGIHDPRTISANYGRNASHLTFRVCHLVFTCNRDTVSRTHTHTHVHKHTRMYTCVHTYMYAK